MSNAGELLAREIVNEVAGHISVGFQQLMPLICSDVFKKCLFINPGEAKSYCCDYPTHCGANKPA